MAQVFDHTIAYNMALPSFGIWGFNLATFEKQIPERWKITVPTRSIGPEGVGKSMIFDKDTGPVKSPINSIFKPKLYQLYTEDMRR